MVAPHRIVKVRIDALRALLRSLLTAAGCSASNAEMAADLFLEADLRGFRFQGLEHLPLLIDELRSGKVHGDGQPVVARETDAMALVEGRRAPGAAAGVFASDVAIKKARKAGCCTVGIVDSGDMFLLGYFVERMARAGVVGLALANATPRVHAFGGIDKVLGTNPIAIGVPAAGRHPIILDFATSAVAGGRIREAFYRGEELALGVGIDRNGLPTQSPAAIWNGGWNGGAMSPMADAKGYGLSLCVALLSGPLVGAGVGKNLVGNNPSPQGHLFVAIDPNAFGDSTRFMNAVNDYIDQIKASRKATGVDAIRVPGERGFAEKEGHLRTGMVAIDEIVWRRTAVFARELAVDMPV